jgi:hypothetical protein
MGHDRSEDTCLHQTDAQGLQSRGTRRTGSLGRQRLIVDPSKLENGSQSNRKAKTNRHKQTNIYMHKNITPCQRKHNKNMQYEIEFATTITQGKETR